MDERLLISYYSIIAGDHKQTSRADRQHVAATPHASDAPFHGDVVARRGLQPHSQFWTVLGSGRFGSANLLRVRSAGAKPPLALWP